MFEGVDPLIIKALWIPLLPVLSYLLLSFLGDKFKNGRSDFISMGAIFGSLALAIQIFAAFWTENRVDWLVEQSWTWIDLSSIQEGWKIDLGVRLDNMSATMLLMVTLCASLIHLFASGYMRDHHGHPEDGYRYNSFFSYLSLFTAAMLGLVISDNLFSLFMCWEVMGLCSYLLIGFYRHKASAANASLKAFMTTRVGDFGLFLGLLALFSLLQSFRFTDIYAAINSGRFDVEIVGLSAAFFIGLGIFIGTVGKSAQFPLQIWLPDAMEGPTPVSALIHAATMVSAGIYLIIRIFPILEYGHVLPIVAGIGGVTAFFAAILAIKQNDIKKVLAYSTLSQLGYMVLALGVGGYQASFFHLITHAVFKACLFLSSGAVIYAMHHEQDMRHMGGLRKKIPITFYSMLIATVAISGVWGFSGFFSKDEILANVLAYAQHQGGISWLLVFFGFATAGMTAFYMFRLIFMTFFGKPHDHHHYDEAHEVAPNMWLPLVILAVCSIGPVYLMNEHWITRLNPAPFVKGMEESRKILEEGAHHVHTLVAIISSILALGGILFSFLVFNKKSPSPQKLAAIWPNFIHKAIDNLYYFDWFYIKGVIQKAFLPFSNAIAWFDDKIIDGILVDGWNAYVVRPLFKFFGIFFDDVLIDGILVDGFGGKFPSAIGRGLGKLQNGKIQRYLMVAVAVLLVVMFFKGAL